MRRLTLGTRQGTGNGPEDESEHETSGGLDLDTVTELLGGFPLPQNTVYPRPSGKNTVTRSSLKLGLLVARVGGRFHGPTNEADEPGCKGYGGI